ncbi:MAG: sporulation initiation factor Spo0A C-terminal domain-containing protein [Lachnospiraceae bacterium]|nr:sporulation initiation factor Spo0A C-terminal domain-containing protein [Lachnospiraceae bacterium]MDE7201168.1 sporulation initiation factor Spo0A C-terminal domain-containing protein [Lachnospiraceae bacterium]
MKVNMDDERSRVNIYRRTTYHMVKCGFRARQKGYRYLREAVWIAYQEPEVLSSVTKRLYPEVAKRFNTTDKQVERAIRNAIETAWNKGDPESLKTFFKEIYGDGTIRPTNTKVIEMFVGFFRNTP